MIIVMLKNKDNITVIIGSILLSQIPGVMLKQQELL